MLSIFTVTIVILAIVAILVAQTAVDTRDLLGAGIMLGSLSLVMMANYGIMGAGDVALTEASVGVIISILFVVSVHRTGRMTKELAKHNSAIYSWGAQFISGAFLFLLLSANSGLAPFGSPTSPAALGVGGIMMREAMPLTQTVNAITPIITVFRGTDTLGETAVVRIGGYALAYLLGYFAQHKLESAGRNLRGVQDSLIAQFVTRGVVPVVIVFGLYVLFHGHYSAGGGFQAGAMVAASVMIACMVLGHRTGSYLLTRKAASAMADIGVLIYAGTGLATIAIPKIAIMLANAGLFTLACTGVAPDYCNGRFLEYEAVVRLFTTNAYAAAMANYWGALIVEIGVFLGVSGTFVQIYDLLVNCLRGKGQEVK